MNSILTVDMNELTFGEDQERLHQGKPFTGTAIAYYPDGTNESSVDYIDGIEIGYVRDWNNNGVLILEAQVRYASYHGIVKHFSDQGNLLRVDGYENGICIKKQEYINGELQTIFIIGPKDSNYKLLQTMRSRHV